MHLFTRRSRAAAVLAVAAALVAAVPALARPADPPPVPHVRHVVEVFLENEQATKTWEDGSTATHLVALRRAGAYIPDFFGVGHASLSNYEAAFAGVAPTAEGKADCLGQPYGRCVFPASVRTIADLLDARAKRWKVYAEGMAGAPGGGPCLHAPSRLLPDPYQGPLTNGYAARHNPPVWFDSVLRHGGSEDYCRAHDVDLTELWRDADAGALPDYSIVVPDTCHDGHDTSSTGGCALDPEGPTAPSGVDAMDAWLPGFVHRLTTSKAWTRDSVLLLTFDESESGDTSGCVPCADGSAGGRIGAVVISGLVRPGTVSTWQGDHYGVLRTLEAAWDLGSLHAHDADPGVTPLTDVWSRR